MGNKFAADGEITSPEDESDTSEEEIDVLAETVVLSEEMDLKSLGLDESEFPSFAKIKSPPER